jgi:hypothetical protein
MITGQDSGYPESSHQQQQRQAQATREAHERQQRELVRTSTS